MAPSPALTGAQREALRTQIAAKRASQVQADRAARAAKDKANIAAGVGKGVPPRKTKTPEYPAQKVKVGKTTVRTKTKVPTTVVQGAPDSERQRKRAAQRPSRAATPQAEKPKNPNYKKAPVKAPAPKGKVTTKSIPAKGTPEYDALVQEMRDHTNSLAKDKNRRHGGDVSDKAYRDAAHETDAHYRIANANRQKKSKGSNVVGGLTMRGPFKTPNPLGPGSKGGIKTNSQPGKLGGKPDPGYKDLGLPHRKPGELPRGKSPFVGGREAPGGGVVKTNSQPGQGASGTGGGRDNPEAGKDRSEFEKQRQRERGTGKDRPPVYKPEDDGQRGGYVNRSKPIPPIPGTSKRPIPGKSTFTGTPGYSAGGSSVVRGLTPR